MWIFGHLIFFRKYHGAGVRGIYVSISSRRSLKARFAKSFTIQDHKKNLQKSYDLAASMDAALLAMPTVTDKIH